MRLSQVAAPHQQSTSFPPPGAYLTRGLVLSSSPHWWALYFFTSAMYLDQASLLPGSACRGGGRGYHLWEQHNQYCHLPSHLLLCLVSASSQQCRSLGTHRLGASPPGLGDRRLKPLYELLHVGLPMKETTPEQKVYTCLAPPAKPSVRIIPTLY